MANKASIFDFSLKLQLRRLPRVNARKLTIVRVPRKDQDTNNDNQNSDEDRHEPIVDKQADASEVTKNLPRSEINPAPSDLSSSSQKAS